jgi:four helix bundle protein
MATIQKFEDIQAWQQARELTRLIYAGTRQGAFAKDYGLRDQVQRAAVSVMANIAEGFERDGRREFIQFLSQAKGSCGEVRSHLYVALDQQYLSSDEFQSLADMALAISRMLSGLMTYLRQSERRGRKFPGDDLQPVT